MNVAPVGAGLVPARNVETGANGATTRVAPTSENVVGAFKSLTTVSYMRGVKQRGWPAFAGRKDAERFIGRAV